MDPPPVETPGPDLLRRQQLRLHRARRARRARRRARRRREVLRQLRLWRGDVRGLGPSVDRPWISMEYNGNIQLIISWNDPNDPKQVPHRSQASQITTPSAHAAAWPHVAPTSVAGNWAAPEHGDARSWRWRLCATGHCLTLQGGAPERLVEDDIFLCLSWAKLGWNWDRTCCNQDGVFTHSSSGSLMDCSHGLSRAIGHYEIRLTRNSLYNWTGPLINIDHSWTTNGLWICLGIILIYILKRLASPPLAQWHHVVPLLS